MNSLSLSSLSTMSCNALYSVRVRLVTDAMLPICVRRVTCTYSTHTEHVRMYVHIYSILLHAQLCNSQVFIEASFRIVHGLFNHVWGTYIMYYSNLHEAVYT